MYKKRSCYFCTENIQYIDYRNKEATKRFISQRGKIVPPRRSGVCAKHQRQLSTAIKRARFMAIVPYVSR